jgi:hypothetical protein
MKTDQIKSAAERQWEKAGIAAIDRPAGWTTPDEAKKSKGGYWPGAPDDLWRVPTKKVREPRGPKRRPSK